MTSPMPMVTLTKTFDVSRLCKISKSKSLKFNMLLCWCIGKAASQIKEMYLLPEHGKLYRYDKLAVNVIVNDNKGGISSCDIPFSNDIQKFNCEYLEMTHNAVVKGESSFLADYMIVGTSAIVATEIDAIVNQYAEQFSNPFLAWAKYRKHLWKTMLPISLQFHHIQMDGGEAAKFLELLQLEIKNCCK